MEENYKDRLEQLRSYQNMLEEHPELGSVLGPAIAVEMAKGLEGNLGQPKDQKRP